MHRVVFKALTTSFTVDALVAGMILPLRGPGLLLLLNTVIGGEKGSPLFDDKRETLLLSLRAKTA
jgi:hypothetical protein